MTRLILSGLSFLVFFGGLIAFIYSVLKHGLCEAMWKHDPPLLPRRKIRWVPPQPTEVTEPLNHDQV